MRNDAFYGRNMKNINQHLHRIRFFSPPHVKSFHIYLPELCICMYIYLNTPKGYTILDVMENSYFNC